ncbi:SpoIIE family protein phosphatase [Streptomyces canus]|uniref:ATP-binding SpoIIE family protein phosphatase n=1 Tax=Streptomyces canus TaxID=58343 RepID=UPI00340F4C22
MILVDAVGVVAGWTEGARRLLGWTAAEAVGRPADDLLTSRVSALVASTEVPASTQVTMRNREGARVAVLLTVYPWMAADGSPRGSVVAASALTEKRLEDLELIDQAFEQCPFVLAIYDEDLHYVRINEAASQATRLDQHAVRGTPTPAISWSEQVREELVEHRRRAWRTGQPVRHVVNARLAGEPHTHAWAHSIWPIKDEHGQVQAVCSWGFDMSAEFWARQRLTLLNEAGRAIGRDLDVARTARELAYALVPQFADVTFIDLLPSVVRGEERPAGPLLSTVTLQRVAEHTSADAPLEAEGDGAPGTGQLKLYPSDSPIGMCMSSGWSQVHLTSAPGPPARFGFGAGLAADPARWPPGLPIVDDSLVAEGVHSRITVPLRVGGTVLGAVVLSRSTIPEPYTADDLIVAEELAAKAAVAIDNARRYARERATALTLQRSLLPQRLPGRAAVETASRYLPAGGQAGVGGDWFDVIPLSGSRVALVVGDVVGHGIHASATMGRLRTAVRTLADVDLPPDELLTHLDDLVIHLANDDQLDSAKGGEAASDLGATCLYAVYDPVTRNCAMATAGHPPPIRVTPEGSAIPISGPIGPPLGIGGLPFEATELELADGTVLALFTDGLIENRNLDIDQNLDTLCRALARPARSLDEACDFVTSALIDGQPIDDIALLLARTRTLSPHQVATWDVPDDPAMVERARKWATHQLGAWGLTEAEFVTELVVSELVTNAIRYGAPPVQLRLIRDRTLICEVSDSSSTSPHLRRARILDEGGRGLLLVAQLTKDWGTRQTTTGKTIWCEQPLPAV